MNQQRENMETFLFGLIDRVKVLLSPSLWENILLDCSKNELLVLLLLYRFSDVNMSQIAEELYVPLNTATGIVGRMEKKGIARRVRSAEDKRIVNIVLSDTGREQLVTIMGTFMSYGAQVLDSLSGEEIELAGRIIEKVVSVLKKVRTGEAEKPAVIRKIEIE